ncbi:hypothetical protein Bbelb_083290 [Branchiostoma belcheri]|nr:hypothetical protein Bbelb_083290 [Branchiostoma belcheri]
MAEEAAGAAQALEGAVGAAAGAARQVVPVIDFSATGHWGGVTLKITDSWIAGGVVVGLSVVGLAHALSHFYRDNRDDVDDIIRRVIERIKRRPRRDGGEPQLDPEVVAIEEGSLYVHVGFRTEDGYDFFSALYDQEYIQTRLKAEFKTLGFQGEIKVILERSQVPGREKEERVGRVDPGVAEMFKRMRIQDVSFRPGRLPTGSDSGVETASVSSQSEVSSEDVSGQPVSGSLLLPPYRDSQTGRRIFQASRALESAAELLTSSGYTDLTGLSRLAEGFIMLESIHPEDYNAIFYDPNFSRLIDVDKKRLSQLTSTQLERNPTDSSCLFLQGALLCEGDSRVERFRQTVNTILQNGEEDLLHPYLHHISCMLAVSIGLVTEEPGPVFAALATALMYKSDHLPTLFFTACCSMFVGASWSDVVQQFHQYLRVAPPCDVHMPGAHYLLAVLYSKQQPVDREKVETHYRMGQEAEKNSLPGLVVQEAVKNMAKKAYDKATSTNM